MQRPSKAGRYTGVGQRFPAVPGMGFYGSVRSFSEVGWNTSVDDWNDW